MSPPKPPDPHPIAHLLLTPLAPWGFRLPLYAVLLAAFGVFGWLLWGSVKAGNEESAAAAKFMLLLKGTTPYHATVLSLQNAAGKHLASGAKHEQAAVTGLISADSAQKLAVAAALAVQQAKTAADSLRGLSSQVGALTGTVDALRVTVGEQQASLADVHLAYVAVRAEADTAEGRVTALESAGRALIRATECRLISWHPCVRNLRIGVGSGYGLTQHGGTVYAGGQLTLAVIWSP
jgi:hypothetical protein